MKPTKPRLFLTSKQLSILALGALAGACTQPQMAVPPGLNQGMDELPVQGRSMASGHAWSTKTSRSTPTRWPTSRGAPKAPRGSAYSARPRATHTAVTRSTSNRAIRPFTASAWPRPAKRASRWGAATSIGKQTAKLGCACGNEGAPTASVVMASETGKTYGGTLKAHGDSYVLKALYERQGAMLSDGGPAGYRVDGKGAVGAVDVMGKGRVWIQKGLSADQRGDLACVFAGLLLYQVPKD